MKINQDLDTVSVYSLYYLGRLVIPADHIVLITRIYRLLISCESVHIQIIQCRVTLATLREVSLHSLFNHLESKDQ